MKNESKVALSVVIITMASLNAFAESSGGVRGGGDPRVAEFLGAANHVCNWIQQNPDYTQYVQSCRTHLADLNDSVNNPNRKAKISFQTADVTDGNGVLKDVVTLTDGSLLGNISRWQSESFQERIMTAAMEMALLIGIPNRYTIAQDFAATSPYVGAAPDTPLANALPSGTQLVATANMSILPNSSKIYFYKDEIIDSNFDQAFTRIKLTDKNYKSCLLGADTSSNYRQITSFTIDKLLTAGNLSYFSLLGVNSANAQFSCVSYNGTTWDPGTVKDFLDSVGTDFNIIFPLPAQF